MSDRRHPQHAQPSRDRAAKDFEAREWRAPTIPAHVNPLSNWNPSNTLGGLQQHTSGSGAQEMPLDIPEDDDGIGQSLYNSMLDMRGYGEVFGQDLPDSSTAESSAPISDEEPLVRLDRLYLRAKKVPGANRHSPWPVEHIDFFEAYVAYYTKPNGTVTWDVMRIKYRVFYDLYSLEMYSKRATAIRKDRSKLSNNWQKLNLDEHGNEI